MGGLARCPPLRLEFLLLILNADVMTRSTVTALAGLVLSGILGITGCSGGTENSVAAPPENPPTAEELEIQSQQYAAQANELRERDQQE